MEYFNQIYCFKISKLLENVLIVLNKESAVVEIAIKFGATCALLILALLA